MSSLKMMLMVAVGVVLHQSYTNASPCGGLSSGLQSRSSAQISAPPGFDSVPCNGKFYMYSSSKKAFSSAQSYCKQQGGRMAAPIDEEENRCVQNKRSSQTVWLDFNDMNKEGSFVDVDGKAITYDKWTVANNEPNDFGKKGEDCATMWNVNTPKGEWNDLHCSSKVAVVCQYP